MLPAYPYSKAVQAMRAWIGAHGQLPKHVLASAFTACQLGRLLPNCSSLKPAVIAAAEAVGA